MKVDEEEPSPFLFPWEHRLVVPDEEPVLEREETKVVTRVTCPRRHIHGPGCDTRFFTWLEKPRVWMAKRDVAVFHAATHRIDALHEAVWQTIITY